MAFRNRVARRLAAGDPQGARVEIDRRGIAVYGSFNGGQTYPLAARIRTELGGGAPRIGTFDGAAVTVNEVIWPSDLAQQQYGTPPVANLYDVAGGDLEWIFFQPGAGLRLLAPLDSPDDEVLAVGTIDELTVGTPVVRHFTVTGRGTVKVDGQPLPLGVLAVSKSADPETAVATTIGKDDPVGNITFEAVAGRSYLVRYTTRCQTSAANTTMDVQIRDGGASPPGTASPVVAAGSKPLVIAGGAGADQLVVEQTLSCPLDLAAGTHTLAAFFRRTAGTGTVVVDTAAGQLRELSVTDTGRAV
jgi:hypothetical protein